MKKTFYISLRITVIFTAIMLLSFVPDIFPSFFGDWKCAGTIRGELIQATDASYSHYNYTGCDYGGRHLPTNHFGYRHWLYIVMGFSLSLVQFVSLMNFIEKKQ